MTLPIILVAASGLAREAVSACRHPEWDAAEVLGYLDDDPGKAGTTIDGLPVLGDLASVTEHPGAQLVVCAGKGASRRAIVRRFAELGVTPDRYATVIDPSVHVPASCSVGAGSILLGGTVLTADVQVGAHVVCMPNVVLTHDDVLADFATLAAGVVLGGTVHVAEAAYIGMNASVREQRQVGAEATLGMGSVLLADQPAGTTWAGVPARPLDNALEARS
ncbi:NeuD/PglB/VioB family sugar acetyltransferase [Brooklawnia sp.]|uniref:NeuD/PglB/VioB family sugar acetyltransferase n=1 Tax=Brooklawnia sp. TaxID=2699740 RepID=UPI00311DC954